MERSRLYDCESCTQRDDFRENQAPGCFLENETIIVEVPEFEQTGGRWQGTGDSSWSYCEPEDFLEILERIQDRFPGKPLGAIWLDQYPRLCPVSFVEPEIDMWISMESAASEYGAMPERGGCYMDQPVLLMDIFDTIRAAQGSYIRWKSLQK